MDTAMVELEPDRAGTVNVAMRFHGSIGMHKHPFTWPVAAVPPR